jgi:hypothetical protein
MTQTWYITNSNDGGNTLNNPEKTSNKPGENFEKYNFPKIWNNFMSNTEGIFINENSNNYIFMSQNPNQLEQLVHLWNSFAEQAGDYIDWE